MISVVIPTYNRPDFLKRLLVSVDKQTYRNFEVIVIDDFSPNFQEYEKVISEFKNKFEKLTFLINSANMGAPYSRNRGIRAAKYDFIALVDDDDEWLPHKLEKQIEVALSSSQDIGIFYTWTNVVDEAGINVREYRSEIEGWPLTEILKECFIPSPSVLVRKDAFTAAGLFDEGFPSCQDWDMWTRIIAQGYRCRVLKEALTVYHKHSRGSVGMSQNAKKGYLKYYKKHLFKSFRCDKWLFLFYLRKIINLRFNI